MKLHFSIEYLTHWGEDVRVSLTLVDAKGRTQTQTYPMETRDGHRWTGEVLITDGRIRSFHYHYSVYRKAVSSGRNGTSYLAVSGPTLLKLICSGTPGRMSPFCLIFILPLLRSAFVRIRPRRKDCRISTVR